MNIEIEKKYIIKLPTDTDMKRCSEYSCAELTQIYLTSLPGVTHRIRSVSSEGYLRYFETKKVRIDKMSSYEDEREISEEDFLRLKENIAKGTREIKKVRHTFVYLGQTFEVDVYPEWKSTCIMETELDSREREVMMPDFIEILRDVTGVRGYSNYAMAYEFPKECDYL